MSNLVNIPRRNSPEQIRMESEAREWVIVLDVDAVSDERMQEFRDWLRRSPQHREAFCNAAAVWGDLDRWAETLFIAETPAGLLEERRRKRVGPRPWRRPALVATLAAAVTAVAVVLLVPVHKSLGTGAYVADFGAGVGQIRSVPLPDGSDVRLNTRSHIAVSYRDTARLVRLTEGEAFFQVSHDVDKPFVVYAGRYAVKAVGTAFSVRLLPGGMELNVTDGRVEVSELPAGVLKDQTPDIDMIRAAQTVVPVAKGHRAVLEDDKLIPQAVQAVADTDMQAQLSWREGLLVFNDDPLERVIDEINRYTEAQVVIADAGIRDLRIGGYFRADNIPAVLSTIEKELGLREEVTADGMVSLSRQTEGSQAAR